MNNKRFVNLLAVCLLLSLSAYTQFEINAEIRPRTEMRNGYKQLPDTLNFPAFFISQRSRMTYSIKREKYTALISFQDVRVWGDEFNFNSSGIFGDNASIDLKEAWFEAYLTPHFTLKAGRQDFKYGDQRLLASRNWNQNGMSYDAVKFSYNKAFTLDIGLSYGNSKELIFNELYDIDKIKTLNFLFIEKDLTPIVNILGLYILTGTQHPDVQNALFIKNTSGAALALTINDLKLSGSGYYQFGKNKSGRQVMAYMWNCNAQYSTNKFNFLAGIDYISGHNHTSNDSVYLEKDHTFDLLYGARHRYYGDMDYFSNTGKSTANGGLVDYYAQTDYSLIDGLSFIITCHHFQLQNNVIDPGSPAEIRQILKKHLANELDAKFSWKVNKEISLEFGYSFLRSYDTLNKIQGISTNDEKNAHWFWLMCAFKPVLFSAGK